MSFEFVQRACKRTLRRSKRKGQLRCDSSRRFIYTYTTLHNTNAIDIPTMPPEINAQRTEDDQPNVSKSFWKSATDIIKATEKHEFLTKMVNGSLPIENFKYYIIQDSLYLADFADGLYRLARTPDIPKEDKNRLEKFAVDAREAEMSLHNGFFKKWNVDAKDAKAMPNTVLYCSNMLRVVSTRCYAEGLAALLPCFWIYMHMVRLNTAK